MPERVQADAFQPNRAHQFDHARAFPIRRVAGTVRLAEDQAVVLLIRPEEFLPLAPNAHFWNSAGVQRAAVAAAASKVTCFRGAANLDFSLKKKDS